MTRNEFKNILNKQDMEEIDRQKLLKAYDEKENGNNIGGGIVVVKLSEIIGHDAGQAFERQAMKIKYNNYRSPYGIKMYFDTPEIISKLRNVKVLDKLFIKNIKSNNDYSDINNNKLVVIKDNRIMDHSYNLVVSNFIPCNVSYIFNWDDDYDSNNSFPQNIDGVSYKYIGDIVFNLPALQTINKIQFFITQNNEYYYSWQESKYSYNGNIPNIYDEVIANINNISDENIKTILTQLANSVYAQSYSL